MGIKSQVLKYVGEIDTDSIFISNHSNVSLVMNGVFKASGLIYCPRYTVRINLRGHGVVSFHGVCRRMEIKVSGDCVLDLTQMSIGEVWCEARGIAKIITGLTKVVRKAEMHDRTILLTSEQTLITNAVKLGGSRIESIRSPEKLDKIRAGS